MSNVNVSNFIINSDYPLPELVSTNKAIVVATQGTTVPSRDISTELPVNDAAQIFRVAFQCDRTGDKIYVAGNNYINFKFRDASYSVYIGAKRNGKISCVVHISQGLDRAIYSTDESAVFTFYVSGFRLP